MLHHTLPTTDTFRHVAEAYGDGNPLWCEPEYAQDLLGGTAGAASLVGGDTLVGDDEVELDDDTRALLKGDPLRGVHAFYAASVRVVGAAAATGGRCPGATPWSPCSTSPAST